MRNLMLACFCFSAALLQAQTAFFVSADGKDSNKGTMKRPFRTIEKALVPVVYPQLFPRRKPVWQERDAAKDAKGIVSVIMAENARTAIICFFMVKPPVM